MTEILTNGQILVVLSFFLLANIKHSQRRELTLYFILCVSAQEVIPYFDNEWFFIVNVICLSLLFVQAIRISLKGHFLAYIPLFLFLISHMLLNSDSLFAYWYGYSILGVAGVINEGNSILTVLELIGLTIVSVNGLCRPVERAFESVLSGVARLIRHLYPMQMHSGALRKD